MRLVRDAGGGGVFYCDGASLPGGFDGSIAISGVQGTLREDGYAFRRV